ncbi:glycoside hydrolase superfamily, partial [Tricladium varicosporioides]
SQGINIAGFEFGCLIDGTCPISSASPPLSTLGGSDGAGQMQHFVKDDQMNIFRLPVSWQYLVNNKLGGTLDSTNFGKYDQLMQACLATGAYCAIDLHNFARFNGKIIGQDSGGPTDAQFADIWSQLATKYKSSTKVIFGLMNEPHDVDITAWANSCQAAVTAIRNVGASSQMILLPGNNFASAGFFVSSGSGAALIKVTNPDGSTTGLILDLHKYLDVDNSGNHAECTTDNIADAFAIVAQFLRENGRQGLVSETGAGSTSSCMTDFCAQNIFLNQNSDVFLGYIAWAAGSFATSYTLSLTPSKQNGKFVDNALASQCVVSPWLNAGTAIVTSAVAASSTASNANTVVISSTSGSAPARSSSSVAEVKTSITTLTSNNGGIKTSSPTTGSVGSAATRSSAATISGSPTEARNSSGTTGSQTTASTQTQVTSAAVAGRIGPRLMAGAGGLLIAALL